MTRRIRPIPAGWSGLKSNNEKIAFLDEYGNTLTYAELSCEAENLSGVVGERRLVFCLCENSMGSALGYVAFINHGIVPLMLNARLEEELLDRLLKIYSPPFVWAPKEQAGRFLSLSVIYEVFGYVLLKTGFEKEYPLHDDLALLLTTSGSTGSPKFVPQSYENIEENTKSIVEYLELDSSERAITTLPMNYTYGLSIINTHLAVGATILLTDKTLMQKEFWQFFKEQGVTSFGGVPYTYEMLDKLRFYRMDLPSL